MAFDRRWMMTARTIGLGVTIAVLLSMPARAQDALVTVKVLSPEIAFDLARAALADCRKRGYQVAVAVVDRFGVTQVVLRDRFAGPHTLGSATRKGWTAVSFRSSTSELVTASREGTPQAGMRQIPGALVLGGGLVIEAAGSLVGGIGVSGAPGGEADEACAKAGIEAVRDRLDF
jgi:uncharacterized protein GlcG (DUF336 family)